MAFSSSPSALSCTPNVTPLIDVLLVLLIIFMVIVPVAPHGLESLVPSEPTTSQSTAELAPLRLEVLPSSAGQGVAYRLDGRPLGLVELRTSLKSHAATARPRSLFVDGDPRLDYQAIASVVGEAKGAGFVAVGLLTHKAR